MNAATRKSFWVIANRLGLCLGAYLIARAVDSLIAAEVRSALEPVSVSEPAQAGEDVRPSNQRYRIIVDRNYFGSALAEPDESTADPEAEAFLRQLDQQPPDPTTRVGDMGTLLVGRGFGFPKTPVDTGITAACTGP